MFSLRPNLIKSWQKTDPRNISVEARLRRPELTQTRAEKNYRVEIQKDLLS